MKHLVQKSIEPFSVTRQFQLKKSHLSEKLTTRLHTLYPTAGLMWGGDQTGSGPTKLENLGPDWTRTKNVGYTDWPIQIDPRFSKFRCYQSGPRF